MKKRSSPRHHSAFGWCFRALFFVSIIVAPQSVAQKVDRARELYDNDELFNQLSGAFRSKLELRFGKKQPRAKEERVDGQTGGTFGKFSELPPAPFSALANSLVNNAAADATARDTQSETAIVLGTGSTVIAGFNDSGSYDGVADVNDHFTGFGRSTDRGGTWTDLGTLPLHASGDAGDPVLTRSASTGTIFFSTLGFNSDDVLQIFRSTNDGASFLTPVNGAPGLTGSAGSHDKQWNAVDNFAGSGFGNVYMFWRNFGSPGGMTFTRSVDDGVTWTPSGGLTLASGGQGAWVTVGIDHAVYCFWLSGTSILLRKSTDQGVSFAASTTVATLLTTGTNGDLGLPFRTNAFPQAAVNPVSGNIYVVYNDNPAGADKGDIYFRQSTDGGATWSSATQLNTDGTTNAQFMPSIAVAPDGGALCVAWYDRRSDPADALIARWGVTAAIAGSSVVFGSNFPISNQFPAVFGVDPVINATYMGDYDQMDADNSFFYVTWGDNRDPSIAVPSRKNANVRFAKIPRAGISPMPVVDLVSSVLSGGNGNGKFDFNECNDLTITLKNNGTASATGISATLTTSTSGVTFGQPTSAYPDLAVGASSANTTAFKVSTAPGFVCGTTIFLTLTVSYTGGADVHALAFPSCQCADTVIVGSIVGGDLQQTSRLFRDGVSSNCVSPKAICPGTSGSGTRSYDTYTFTNTTATTTCVTATLTPNCSVANLIFAVAYTGSFSSGNVCTNYLADLGASPNNGSSLSFGFNISALGTVVVVVNEVNAATGCSSYTLTLSGLLCSADGGGGCTPLPIQLASFTGTVMNHSQVRLDWMTLSEINNYGFEVQKSVEPNGNFQTIPGSFIPGHGTTNEPQHYTYVDVAPQVRTLYYRLKQIDLDGTVHYVDPIRVDILTSVPEKEIPAEFSLSQNYPNPFNPSTEIKYGLPVASEVKLEVFNILGQVVAGLVNEKQEAGFHSATFEGASLASGVYVYKIQAGAFVAAKKFLLLK